MHQCWGSRFIESGSGPGSNISSKSLYRVLMTKIEKKNCRWKKMLWVIVALLDPDPDPGIPLNPDPYLQHSNASIFPTIALNFAELSLHIHFEKLLVLPSAKCAPVRYIPAACGGSTARACIPSPCTMHMLFRS
jgi:hypothetical protein